MQRVWSQSHRTRFYDVDDLRKNDELELLFLSLKL